MGGVCSWKGGWFYYKPLRGDDVATRSHRRPGVQYLGKLARRHHGLRDIRVDDGVRVNIPSPASSSSSSHGLFDDGACSFSSTPVHLVAQSPYNEMMCEFHPRTISGLNRRMRDRPPRGRSNDDVRMYVRFVEDHDLLEGRRLFLSGSPNDGEFGSFASLMPTDDACRCCRELVFCGYQAENATSVKSNPGHAFLGDDFD